MKLSHALMAFTALAGGAFTATSAAAQQATGVIVVDMARIRAQADAYKDLALKLRTVAEQQGATFKTENEAEAKAIDTQLRTLGPSLQGKTPQEIAANPQLKSQYEQLAQRQQALERKQQIFQASLQKTSACAEAALGQLAEPVIDQLMKKNNASVVLSRDVVAMVSPTVDVTQDAIAQLNAKTKTAKVVWAPFVEGQQDQSCPK
jgi:Skp family chaperone for outer membrane proteins